MVNDTPPNNHGPQEKALQGKVVVIGNRGNFMYVKNIFEGIRDREPGRQINVNLQHYKTVKAALDELHKADDVNLVFIDERELVRTGDRLEGFKSRFDGDVEFILLSSGQYDTQELLEMGREGAHAIFNVGKRRVGPRSPEIGEKSTEALRLSARKKRSPIKKLFVQENDRQFIREILDGVDIISPEFWNSERCREYANSRAPLEMIIVDCEQADRNIRTFSNAQHKQVRIKTELGGDGVLAFHLKAFTNPKGAGDEYIAPAIYEADKDMEKRLTDLGRPSRFMTVKYEGYAKTRSGLYLILKHRRLPTIDYYFLLYTPKIRDLTEEHTAMDKFVGNLYNQITEFTSDPKNLDIEKLVEKITEATREYSGLIDTKTIRAGAAHILKLRESKEPMPSKAELLDDEKKSQNPNKLFERINDALKELRTNIHNYERARDALIIRALDAIADNDARWTANRTKIEENIKKFTGNKRAKITNYDSQSEKDRGRLERYLKDIYLFRCERDLRKGATYETDIDAVNKFSLFSPNVKTSVSKDDFRKVSDLFAAVMGEKELFVLTQGDMRLQHIFFDRDTGPEVFDYGRAREERRGISAMEFLIDHILNLNCAQIENFLGNYYDTFIERYTGYCKVLGIEPNIKLIPGAASGDTALRDEQKHSEIRACFLLGLLYRFRKMGPISRDSLRYKTKVSYPKERIAYPVQVEIVSNGTRRVLDQSVYDEVDPNSFKDQNNYYSPNFILDYHLNEIKSIISGALGKPERRFLSEQDRDALKILHKMLSSHEICIETQGQTIKKKVSLYDKTCEPYKE